jgi:predicted Zn-ribbon and HTH transcriptional regulator
LNQIRTYYQKDDIPLEVRRKLHISKLEAENLTLRDIACPYCGYLVERVFSDITGHKMIYCKKCKEEYPVNLGYFRRMKQRRHIKHLILERQLR